jgi:hypothetical protein
MHGNSRVRFCDHCQKNVYNLSAMTRASAEALLAEHEGHLCARLYRREDGTVITTDCGGGWKLRARKLSRVLAGVCAALLGGMFVPRAWSEPMPAIAGEIALPAKMIQGDVCVPAPTTQPAQVAATTQPTTKPVETIKERRAKLPRPQVSNMPERIEAPPAKE